MVRYLSCGRCNTNKSKIKEIFQNYYILIEVNLEIKFPKIWRDEKAVRREKSQERKDQKKEDAGARKGRKVAKYCVFSWFCGSGGLKSKKWRVRNIWRDKR